MRSRDRQPAGRDGRHGYTSIGTWKWGVTNYDSIVLAKDLIT
ncbi:hypothetical protein [Planomonospora sp. ID67723]|nr:hypothetical protein [Planomonospora sp. ID67723]